MQVLKRAFPALGLLFFQPHVAHAAAYVLGDSIGEGVAQVSHLKGLARVSVHIRGPRILEQFAQTPPNSTVFLVLGTNDANGSISNIDKSINDVVAAAERKHLTLIWLGPPCVRKSWDTRSRELDGMLKAKFENTAIRYISMRDPEMCSGAFQEPDGVHLKTKGYLHMWQKAVGASGFSLASATSAPVPQPMQPPQQPATAAASTTPAQSRFKVTVHIPQSSPSRSSTDTTGTTGAIGRN